MESLIRRSLLLFFIIGAGLMSGACTSGGIEGEFAKSISDINKDWVLYEVIKKGDSTIIRIEVYKTDKVTFKDAKKAMGALQKVDPQLTGYIEFYNSDVGIVLRKIEVFPSAT